MRRLAVLGVLLAAHGCGRVAFDPVPTDDGGSPLPDGPGGDGAAPFDCQAAVAATCGATGASSCCESPLVPGGSFARSYDPALDAMFPVPTNTASVSDFRLDRYEITVGRFRQFVLAGKGTQLDPPASGAGAHAMIAASGWDVFWNASLAADTAALTAGVKCNATTQTWTDAPAGNENRPMNCLSWYEAMAFCAWDGGYLPTEAEWNYAAAGGVEQRAYPWSSPASMLTLDGLHASYSDGITCVGDGQAGCTVDDLVPVGSKPAGDGKWTHSDLAGNVWEWTLDVFGDPYAINPCLDCAELTPAGGRAVRGGYFSAPAVWLRGANRFGNGGNFRSSTQGARCARRP